MTDTQIRDRINAILAEQFGDVLRNRELTRREITELLDKLVVLLTGPAEQARGKSA